MENITEMLKGVLEGCVLEIISRGETYGYEITQQLRKLGFTDVVEGTVYTITMRLEKNNLVNVEKKKSNMFAFGFFYAKINGDLIVIHPLFQLKFNPNPVAFFNYVYLQSFVR
ncbi:PadR family transcriptional regulator [Ornithinibacillus halotolerans]|uniref:Transcription regulator PadR N-terminal domain-containing protein n=1 Tax=Ornithinibacillus halotolerans TaxID=1274357 RepID=A0A916W8A1_9BACI|nr:PadR family transcriptional regulator [Ornithinibacillus halotolerans]GGA74836.1 hypothetical protein GCM10008025_18200 [Ornithinibacillus halotolerans]